MNSAPLKPGTYGYHDLSVGDYIDLGPQIISGALIDQFADLSGDKYALHLDNDFAGAHGFDRRVAHGLLILSVIDGMKNNAAAKLNGLVSLDWNWQFAAPVLVDDAIHARLTITQKRKTRTGNRGILTLDFKVYNQNGAQVQTGQNALMFDL